jgi:hypothetical protein
MRPKSFKGKLCAYCAESVCESADHVFAREFFPQDDRGNTPKVPACNRCNNLKAELERYATCTLPFGSRHPTALKVMEEKMPRRLKENLHTRRELLEGQGRVLVHEPDGHLLSVTTFTVGVQVPDQPVVSIWLSRGAPKPARAGRFKTGQCADAFYTSSVPSVATFP